MADEQQSGALAGNDQAQARAAHVDPSFLDAVNAYLAVSGEQTRKFGARQASMAMNYAAARHTAYLFFESVKPADAAQERKEFLDYMSTTFRRMLNEHLDSFGEERGIDVGDSELAAEYAAAGVRIGRLKQTAAADDVAAGGASPDVAPDA